MAYNISLLFHDYYFQVKNIKNKNKNKLFSAETSPQSLQQWLQCCIQEW